jgi:hypothetical protein
MSKSDHKISKNDFQNFEFGDKRLNKRASLMVKRMAKRIGSTLPKIFTSHAELHGAYRFFKNDLVTPQKIIMPHREATLKRTQQCKHVLVIQDTTDVSFDHVENLEEFGKIHPGVKKGLRIHPQFLLSEHGTPLGVVEAEIFTRSNDKLPSKNRNQQPLEEKESYRWLKGLLTTCDLAKENTNTAFVSIADREGDIYECFEHASSSNSPENAFLIIRAQHNRCLGGSRSKSEGKIQQKLIRQPVAYEAEIIVNKGKKNERLATVRIRATDLLLRAPQTSLKKGLEPIKVNAVMVSEVDPPEKEKAIKWVLLSNLPIDTVEEIKRIVSFYSMRWQIEVFFKVLKSGCRIDNLQLESAHNICNYITMALIVAWKVMLTVYLPRELPNAPCTLIFTELEWKLVYLTVYKKKKPLPKDLPTLREITALVASLGGYIKRKSPPGIETVWCGIVRLMDIVQGYELSQELIGAK